jgi:hypothetical protein
MNLFYQKRIFTFYFVLVFNCLHLHAQNSGSIIGYAKAINEGLPGVNIILRNESTGFETGTVTNADGYYEIKQVPTGGPYSTTAQMIGYGQIKKTGYQIEIGSVIRIDFSLEEKATELQEIVVTDKDLAVNRVSPLGISTRLGATEMRNLPATGRSFFDLNTVAPTVNSILTGNVSIGGARPSSTAITLDGANIRGMTFGGLLARTPVSIEAIREYEVSTNNYSVLEGRQAGGAINAITKSGTNNWTGSAFYFIRNNRSYSIAGTTLRLAPELNYVNQPIRDFRIAQYGFSVGGPIVKDKVHFFVAMDVEDQTNQTPILDVRPGTEAVEQISQANLDRFVNILRTQYASNPEQPQYGIFRGNPYNRTAFVRLDWQINPMHRLTWRNNGFWNFTPFTQGGATAVDPAGVWDAYGNTYFYSAQSMLSLRSSLNPSVTNEFKLQYMQQRRDARANNTLPRGHVTITSPGFGTRTFQFGGSRIVPEDHTERQVQLVNNTYIQRGKFFFTLGTDNLITMTDITNTNEQGGLFLFANLDSLERRRPTEFTRLTPTGSVLRDGKYSPRMDIRALDISFYAMADVNLTKNISANVGLRYDATAFLNTPAANQEVSQVLGKETNRIAADWNNLQPRLQITWDVKGDQTTVVRAGVGGYAANLVHYVHLNNILQNGLTLTDQFIGTVRDAGGAIVSRPPEPDYPGYLNGTVPVPGTEAGGVRAPYVNLVGKDFAAPYTWKGNVALRHFITPTVYVGVNPYFARTINNFIYTDVNLKTTPEFVLANEDNRPVYAPSPTTNPATSPILLAPVFPVNADGSTNTTAFNGLSAQRFLTRDAAAVNQNASLGRTLELNGKANVWQRGIVLETGIVLPRGGSIQATFTRNRTEDDNSYDCCIARTSVLTAIAGDPRNLQENRGGSDSDFKTKLVIFGVTPSVKGFRLSFRNILQGGLPFSPRVFGDIVGDGRGLFIDNNKRAFIFDPAVIRNNPNATRYERQLASDMEFVLNNPNNIARKMLNENLGKIAPRNAVYQPLFSQLDVRLSYTLSRETWKTLNKNSLELIAEVFNFGNLINPERGALRTVPGGNQVLLQTLGIDQEALAQGRTQYAYRVNRNFGQTALSANIAPYQVQIGMRYNFQ